MNAEYLLDIIGRLDDDLVQEAENYRRPKARHGAMLGWAASVAVVIALGYVLAHLGMNGAAPSFSGGGNGAAPSSGNTTSHGDCSNSPGAPASGDTCESQRADVPLETTPPLPGGHWSTDSSGGANAELAGASKEPGDASPGLSGKVLSISLRMDEPMNRFLYTFFHHYDEDRILKELPEGCVKLGRLEGLSEIEEPNVPYTDSEAYAGCPVWLLREDPVQNKFKLYVQLPEGGYLECQ